MLVKVRYFGRVRRVLGTKRESYEVENGATLNDLILKHIPDRHKDASEDWKQEMFRIVKGKIMFNADGTPVLADYTILRNGRTPSLSSMLKNDEEFMIMPPISGG